MFPCSMMPHHSTTMVPIWFSLDFLCRLCGSKVNSILIQHQKKQAKIFSNWPFLSQHGSKKSLKNLKILVFGLTEIYMLRFALRHKVGHITNFWNIRRSIEYYYFGNKNACSKLFGTLTVKCMFHNFINSRFASLFYIRQFNINRTILRYWTLAFCRYDSGI